MILYGAAAVAKESITKPITKIQKDIENICFLSFFLSKVNLRMPSDADNVKNGIIKYTVVDIKSTNP